MNWNLYKTRTPGTRRTLAGALVLLLALGLLVASAIPVLGVSLDPGHTFYGVATINGAAAADGALVEAKIGATVMASAYVDEDTVAGQYWLMVPKDDSQTAEKDGGVQGDTVDFYVDGTWAASYIFFNPDDSTTGYEMSTRVDLAVTAAEPETYTLTVTSTGCCTITVEDPYVVIGTIAAGDTDDFVLDEDTVVTLIANITTTCQFDGWTVDGVDCANNPTTVTMDADHTVVAYCTTVEPPVTYELYIESIGCGDIAMTVGSFTLMIPGGTSSTHDVAEGAVVELEVVNTDTCQFDEWIVDEVATTDNPVYITMDSDHSATGYSTTVEPPVTYELTVTSVGCCPVTISWCDTCSETVNTYNTKTLEFNEGTVVTLTAGCSTYCEFINWVVDGVGVYDNPITVTMDADHNVTSCCQITGVVINQVYLKCGWNTFSVPILLDEAIDTWGEFIEFNDLDIGLFLSYDPIAKAWIPGDLATPLKPLDGYYVYMNDPGYAKIVPNTNGSDYPVKTLQPGLNLVGVATLHDEISIYEFLYITDWEVILSPYINSSGWTEAFRTYEYTETPMVEMGRAYWVYMETTDDLLGLTSTPVN